MSDAPEEPVLRGSRLARGALKFFVILAIVLVVLFACMVIGARLPGVP